MHHQHFTSISSTQTYLKENIETLLLKNRNLLVSTSQQLNGRGRKNNTWDSYPNSLALSCTVFPHATPAFTPLEIGTIVIDFLKYKFNKNILLKWPNDIINQDGEKCGGILCQYYNASLVIIGIGLNFGKIENINHQYRHGLGSVDKNITLNNTDQEKIAAELYRFLLDNRLKPSIDTKKHFNHYCSHLNKKIKIEENEKNHVGIFRGIGDNGEALVEIENRLLSFYSSSLTVL